MLYAQKIKYFLEVDQNNYKFCLFVRYLSVLLVGFYVKLLYDAIFEWYAYTTSYFIRSFIEFTIIGMICNFGLFFITTKAAKKLRVWTTTFYLPTFFITPLALIQYLPHITYIIIFLLGAIYIYWCLNPWKQ